MNTITTNVATRQASATEATCRFCTAPLTHTFVDLGMSPLCESYVSADRINEMEPFYPLHVFVCGRCFLVQLQQYVSPEHIFSEYAYFSSYSDSWVQHSKTYADLMIDRFNLTRNSRVIELASNDGYLLQHFVAREIPVLGIEPAANVAEVAHRKGIPTIVTFFGERVASELMNDGMQADLIAANNVLAQVPDVNDFVKGIKRLLKPDGVVTLEFPHVVRLMAENQFDTIYHEHFSYFSLYTTEKIFEAHGLTIFDVDELTTHGGSLRIYARNTSDPTKQITSRLLRVRALEETAGVTDLGRYSSFTQGVIETKRKLLEFLIRAKRDGKSIAGYGAPGKGNTLLNYCGIRTDFIDYTVDRNPYKQGKFLPGTHIPILSPDTLMETKPDYVLILPWNLKEEIMKQMSVIREWGGQFVVPIPEVRVY